MNWRSVPPPTLCGMLLAAAAILWLFDRQISARLVPPRPPAGDHRRPGAVARGPEGPGAARSGARGRVPPPLRGETRRCSSACASWSTTEKEITRRYEMILLPRSGGVLVAAGGAHLVRQGRRERGSNGCATPSSRSPPGATTWRSATAAGTRWGGSPHDRGDLAGHGARPPAPGLRSRTSPSGRRRPGATPTRCARRSPPPAWSSPGCARPSTARRPATRRGRWRQRGRGAGPARPLHPAVHLLRPPAPARAAAARPGAVVGEFAGTFAARLAEPGAALDAPRSRRRAASPRRSDRDMLRQVLVNLCDNSAR